MDEKQKKTLYFIGTVVVAIAFVSSYASVGSFATTTSTTTTITAPSKTYFVSGIANGVVSGYSNAGTLKLNNLNLSSETSNILAALERNGSISSYIGFNDSYQVFLGTMDAYSLQQYVNGQLNYTNATTMNASTYVTLPSSVTGALGGQSVPIKLQHTNYSVSIYPLLPLNATVTFKLNAIVSGNGTVYNNQVTLKRA